MKTKLSFFRNQIRFACLLALVILASCTPGLLNMDSPAAMGDETGTGSSSGQICIRILTDPAEASQPQGRTVLPVTGTVAKYSVSIHKTSDATTVYGSLAPTALPQSGKLQISLSALPQADDITILAKGLDGSNNQIIQGSISYGTKSAFWTAVAGGDILLRVRPTASGTGKIELPVQFPNNAAHAVEASLYEDYDSMNKGILIASQRFRLSDSYGSGSGFDSSPPANHYQFTFKANSVPSGNRILKLDFFRGAGLVKTSTVIESLIVRDNSTTSQWVDPQDGTLKTALILKAAHFASANAGLAGISVGEDSLENFDPAVLSYSDINNDNLGASPALAVAFTLGASGQAYSVTLNGAAETGFSKDGLTHSKTGVTFRQGSNNLQIKVTSPDGLSQNVYSLNYIIGESQGSVRTVYHVKAGAAGDGDGSDTAPFNSVQAAVNQIKATYTTASPAWPGKGSGNRVTAVIIIDGTFSETISIEQNDEAIDDYPPIVLQGKSSSQPAVINNTLLSVRCTDVTLGGNITLQGAANPSDSSRCAVYIERGTFTMNGGIIRSALDSKGRGIYVAASSSLRINSGTISGFKGVDQGGGVYLSNMTFFTMNGGSITGNTVTAAGGGIYAIGSDTSVTINGGSIDNNKAENNGSTGNAPAGGGIYISCHDFKMNGGSITGNAAVTTYSNRNAYGGGIYLSSDSMPSINGGSISGNSASAGPAGYSAGGGIYSDSMGLFITAGSITNNKASIGGGVYFKGLTLSGGRISGNSAAAGGGLAGPSSLYLTMSGGEISGNRLDNTLRKSATIDSGGAGVYISGSTVPNDAFIMTGGTISMNEASSGSTTVMGGGVFVYQGRFSMSGGSIMGNSSLNEGGGVMIHGSADFVMSGGVISGNSSTLGGGVYVGTTGSTKMSMSGTCLISGNTASSHGGGVFLNTDAAGKIEGNTAANLKNNTPENLYP